MVLAYHLILTAYGFWLPNDPRGSWSDFVGAWELLRYGKATTVNVRRSVASQVHDQKQRRAAKQALKYAAVTFNGLQARAIANAFAEYARASDVCFHACSIMPDHVHLVVRRHARTIEQIANQLKGAATRKLRSKEIHPLQDYATASGRPPKMWARGQWSVYLNSAADIERAIQYVEDNPVREGLKPQRWTFVRSLHE